MVTGLTNGEGPSKPGSLSPAARCVVADRGWGQGLAGDTGVSRGERRDPPTERLVSAGKPAPVQTGGQFSLEKSVGRWGPCARRRVSARSHHSGRESACPAA